MYIELLSEFSGICMPITTLKSSINEKQLHVAQHQRICIIVFMSGGKMAAGIESLGLKITDDLT